MPARRKWAACSNGASSASARSVQWADSPVRPSGRAAPAMARARTRDSSHVVAETTGDQRSRVTPAGARSVPLGSRSQQRPASARPLAVVASRSGLVEVTATAPGAASTFGMATPVVLPDRGGPSTSRACWGSARASPLAVVPRYSRPPESAR